MEKTVRSAFSEWCAGLVLGAIPLTAHAIAFVALNPADENHVMGGWAIDLLFVSIALSGSSVVSVLNRLGSQGVGIMRGRSAPTLLAATVTFLVCSSIVYAGAVTGHGRDNQFSVALGLMLGSIALSLYLDLTMANTEVLAQHAPS